MLARKDEVVKGLTDGVRFLFKKNKIDAGLRHRRGSPRRRRSSSRGDDGGETTLEAGHILLATGSEPIALPFLPFDGKTIVSSTEALTFDRVPEHLIVVGGGYIGLELGSVWTRLGAKVTVLEFLPRILPLGRRRDRRRCCTSAWRSRGSSSTWRPRSPARRSRAAA